MVDDSAMKKVASMVARLAGNLERSGESSAASLVASLDSEMAGNLEATKVVSMVAYLADSSVGKSGSASAAHGAGMRAGTWAAQSVERRAHYWAVTKAACWSEQSEQQMVVLMAGWKADGSVAHWAMSWAGWWASRSCRR